MPVRVSVIVPAFNAEATLEAGVNSLLGTCQPDLEILVVDDGSCDATLAIAQQLADDHPGVVRVLTHAGGAHRGVSASRNLGICASSGDFIAFLDADDLVLPHRFQTSVAMMCERTDIDGVYELTEIVNRNQQDKTEDPQWRDGAVFGIDAPLVGGDLLRKLMTGIPWHGNAFLCRRGIFERIGVFDEDRAMAEDCHMWIRAAAGAMIVPADPLNIVCLYIRHGSNSYQYSLQSRIDLLDAMADAGLWIRQNAPMHWPLWQAGFTSYLARCMIAAREADSLKMLRKQVELCIHYRLFRQLLQWQVMRQILSEIKRRLLIIHETQRS